MTPKQILLELLEKENLTLAEAAKRLSINISGIKHYVYDTREISWSVLEEYASKLGYRLEHKAELVKQ